MSIIRRAANGASALLLAFSSVLTLMVPSVAHAAGQTCTWTGTGVSVAPDPPGRFSDPENWANCGNGAPTNNDVITFDVSTLVADKTATNDIAGLVLDGIQITGNSQNYNLTIAGNITVNGDITANSFTSFSGALTLAKDVSITGDLEFAEGSAVVTAGHTLTKVGGYLYMGSTITGAGAISASGNGAHIVMFGNATGYTGALQSLGGGGIAINPDILNASSAITVSSGSTLTLCGFAGKSVQNELTVGGVGSSGYGGAITSYSSICRMGGAGSFGDAPTTVVPAASVNWTGPITLTADTVVAGDGEFKVSGALSGAYTLSQVSGSVGKVTIASSSNTSKTPNGAQTSQLLKTTYGENKPTDMITVGANEEATLTGTYESAIVMGGTFKGNGILKGDLQVTKSATVAPGMSPGCLTSDTLSLAGTYLFEIGGTEACTGYDQLKVLNASNTADAVTLDDTTATLTTSLYNGFAPKKGQTYVIVDQGGDKAVKGTFKDLPEGATFTQNGIVFKISYVGGTGNDVTLTVQSVPATPDTGLALVSAHPLLSLLTIGGIGVLLVGLARRSNAISKKRS